MANNKVEKQRPRFSIQLPDELRKQINELAKKKYDGNSSLMVRIAIKEFIARSK